MSGITTREIKQPAGSGSIGVITNVTYAQAVALQTAGTIVPGALYRMTDFQTLHKLQAAADRNDTNVVIPIEVLVLTGLSTTTFEKNVYSESFPNDVIEYTTDNTAWKDLQIAGQKGCITLRIDPIRNIEVGNGDWRNFIVRRWCGDFTVAYPYGRGNRWVLPGASNNFFGKKADGSAQNIAILSATLYDAGTNPTGYKDVRLFLPASGRGAVNVRIKGPLVGDNTGFQMPNFHIETTGANTNTLNNVHIENCSGSTVTNELFQFQAATFDTNIFLESCTFQSSTFGQWYNNLIATLILFTTNIGNLIGSTLYSVDLATAIPAGGQFTNINDSYISILSGGNNPFNNVIVNGCATIISSIAKGGGPGTNGVNYRLNGLNGRSVINNTPSILDVTAKTINVDYDQSIVSNFETSLVAVAALVLGWTGTPTNLQLVAGIINLTGAGTVNIATLTRLLPNNFPVTLKPQAGLIISIAQNNVANGFINKDLVTANGTNGEVIILTPIGDRWSAHGNKIGAIATYQPADPATTNSLVGVMMGLAISITPTKSGNVMIVLNADIDNDTPLDGSQIQIRFGTGAAPANGAALTGTVAGSIIKMINADATIIGIIQTPGLFPIGANSLLPLTANVANWVDISLASITGGVSRIRDISVTLIEQ